MRLIRWTNRHTRRALVLGLGVCQVLTCFWMNEAPAYGQRVFGLDTSSAANTAVSQQQWNNAYNSGWAAAGIPSFQFAFVRSSRGGLSVGNGMLDDAQFYDNISRATNAGMLAGSYHYSRADLWDPVTQTGNSGFEDATHYLNRAGMYMKPGYLLPVFDLEAGNTQNTAAQLTAWSLDWIDTIYNATGIYPIVYTNSSYNNDEVLAQVAWKNFGSTPKSDPLTYQWVARPSGSITTGQPGAATNYPNPYGVWDPNFITRTNSRNPAIKPWAFWQNGSAQIDPSNPSSSQRFLVDFNAANGNLEFVKDFLVPALWTNPGSGDWGTIANWNSNNSSYNGTIQSGPAPRLPNNQSLDWVKLQNSGNGTVTISSGARTVRKFYTQQPLNITGGSLSVGYTPGSGGQFDLPSEFNAAVTMSSGTAYSAHTTQVDGGGGTFNVNGGTLTFREIQLASHASNSGKLVLNGTATFAQTGGAGTSIIRSTGSLAQAGSVTLSAGTQTFNVNNGSANVDLQVHSSVTGAGRLAKDGAGAMLLSETNTYSGGTTISAGVLDISADSRLGTVPGSFQSNNIVLDGGTLRTGAQINSVSLGNTGTGYTSFPALTINGAGPDAHPASVNVLAGISTIAVTSGGSGYVNQSGAGSPPSNGSAGTFVDIIGGGGTGATARATVSSGAVTAITIVNPGTGYTSIPTIYISSTAISGVAGSGATASVNGITLQSAALNNGGFDYTAPTISLAGGGGTGATASATSTPSISFNSNRGISLTANGGTLNQTTGTTLTVSAPISSTGSGALTKSGAGTLVLSGPNTYSGATTVSAGMLTLSGPAATLGDGNVTVQGSATGTALTIQSGVINAIDDNATLSLLGGGTAALADQGYVDLGSGINEIVGALLLNGAAQVNGLTYGSTLSSALVQSNEFFAGIGLVSVGLLGDFNNDDSVNAGDYVVWAKNPSTYGGIAGYNLWRSNFGSTAFAAGSSLDGPSVPEPASIGLLILGLAILTGIRRVS